MIRSIPLLAALPLAVCFGVVEGNWSGRWHADDLNEQSARLAKVPLAFGDWEGKTKELDRRQIAIAKLAGYLNCDYVNRTTGEQVSVLLTCGRPGPITAHTPDICFPGGGHEMSGNQQRLKFTVERGQPAEFWAVRFDNNASMIQRSAVLWAWTTDGAWAAPDYPRDRFAGSKALFKLYVIHGMTKPGQQRPADDHDVEEFLHDFLPQVRNALFPST